jgi:hypothetical protein
MSFFNKKEEVIYFKLTPHGRHLLSLGKFKPKYYSFFDDNILYAPEYADFEQKQNEVEARIQDNTPYSRAQHSYSGVERNLNSLRLNCTNGQFEIVREQHDADKHYVMSAPLGSSDIGSEYAPAWQTIFLRSEISSSIGYHTGSFATSKIPQLHITVPYEISTLSEDEYTTWTGNNSVSYRTEAFEDGTSLAVEGDIVLVDVLENNTEFLKDNFYIEVFEIEKVNTSGSIRTPGIRDSRSREKLIPLSFVKRPQEVVDDILLDDDEIEKIDPAFTLDETYVEYYFDIKLDNQISPSEICKSLQKLERKNVYLDIGYEASVDCEEYNSNVPYYDATYVTDITDEDSDQC